MVDLFNYYHMMMILASSSQHVQVTHSDHLMDFLKSYTCRKHGNDIHFLVFFKKKNYSFSFLFKKAWAYWIAKCTILL